MQEVEREANDPYSDDNKAPFYRQPIGLRRTRKEKEKEEAGTSLALYLPLTFLFIMITNQF